MNLDLDKEYIPISEDKDDTPCHLCTHNHDFLTMQHRVLLLKCNKRNLYDLLFKAYEERMRPVKQQNQEVPPITRKMIETHFEQHTLTYNRGVQHDARVVQQLMEALEGRLKLKDGTLDTASVSLWKQLSTYKLQLLKKLAAHERVDTIVEKPYTFD